MAMFNYCVSAFSALHYIRLHYCIIVLVHLVYYITLHPQVIVSRSPAAAVLVRNDCPAFVDNKTFVVGCSQPPLAFSFFVFLLFPFVFSLYLDLYPNSYLYL